MVRVQELRADSELARFRVDARIQRLTGVRGAEVDPLSAAVVVVLRKARVLERRARELRFEFERAAARVVGVVRARLMSVEDQFSAADRDWSRGVAGP